MPRRTPVSLLGFVLTACMVVLAALPVHAAEDTAAPPPAPEGVSAELWEKLLKIDEAVTDIEDMEARFDRLKHTPLLRKPLVSHGRVRVKGRLARWDTQDPYPSTTLMREGRVQIYQPEDKRLEVYDLGDRLDVFGASPLPRMSAMAERFTIEQRPAHELFDDLEQDEDEDKFLALQLTPKDEQISEHLSRLALLMDQEKGRLTRLRLYPESDRSWTEYRFHDMRLNRGIEDEVFELELPADVQVVQPLEGAEP